MADKEWIKDWINEWTTSNSSTESIQTIPELPMTYAQDLMKICLFFSLDATQVTRNFARINAIFMFAAVVWGRKAWGDLATQMIQDEDHYAELSDLQKTRGQELGSLDKVYTEEGLALLNACVEQIRDVHDELSEILWWSAGDVVDLTTLRGSSG